MKATESREELIGSRDSALRAQSEESLHGNAFEKPLTATEKKFLLTAERGDCATVKRLMAEYKDNPEELDINCVDPLNRSALTAAIENENIELIRILLDSNIKTKDSLLHAIKEEYVEAVEILLEWEEKIHVPGQPYSWEAVDRSASNFTPDITPLILAAHMNNYEILKILLDRGASLPMPHDVRCGCDECVASSEADSLRHSQARINAYRALAAPSLIALSSRDPLLTAFELSWELRRLSRMENEFRDEYNEMRAGCQEFATSLLDHARTSLELEVMLNHNPDGEPWSPGERHSLERLKLAIKYKQKKFVAHPNVQQLLAAIWYEGLPGFRRKNMVNQLLEVFKLGSMFPVYSTVYMLAPTSKTGLFVKKPFVKFIMHSSSYAFFLTLLGLASQRVEFLLIEWFGTDWMRRILHEWQRKERGALPGPVEFAIIIYVLSLIWNEMRSLYCDGLLEYVNDLWNIVDFITNIFYLLWIGLRFSAWYIVQKEHSYGLDPWYPREKWDPFDPMLLSEGAFAAGMIFSFLKLVHIFSVNPHLGPLQISLGRMIIDILKFFFIYSLVLFAFGCGMNQLLWYYADLEKHKCYHLPGGLPDFDKEEKACHIWRRFANLFEASQSLFWASFGLVDLDNFELTGIKGFTRFWALLMFGSYSVINIIVLLNMLIAMMSNSYQIISERSDTEWKFARSKLWISYFEEGDTVPPPFNMLPSTKLFGKLLCCAPKDKNPELPLAKSRSLAQDRHDLVIHQIVRRYVTAEQRKRDDFGITEDDVMEIRQDISTLRYELIDILRTNGMRTPSIDPQDATLESRKQHVIMNENGEINQPSNEAELGTSLRKNTAYLEKNQVANKKGRVMERRLLKDFQIGFVEGLVKEAIASDKGPRDVFSKIAKAIGKRASAKSQKKDWNAMVRRSTVVRDPIGSTNEARDRRQSRQSIRRYILENKTQQLDPAKLVEYNPKLSEVTPAARVAYAKFKMNKIKQEYDQRGDDASIASSVECMTDKNKIPDGTPNSVAVTPSPCKDKEEGKKKEQKPGGNEEGKKKEQKPADNEEGKKKEQKPGDNEVSQADKKSPNLTASISRPRPRSSLKTPAGTTGAIPPPSPSPSPPPPPTEPVTVTAEVQPQPKEQPEKKDFRAPTPIPEDPAEDEDGRATPQSVPATSSLAPPPTKPDPSPRRTPMKPTGKSTISGQNVTGWL